MPRTGAGESPCGCALTKARTPVWPCLLVQEEAKDEEKRAATMLEKLTDVQLDLDVAEIESAPSNVERETGVSWRDAD